MKLRPFQGIATCPSFHADLTLVAKLGEGGFARVERALARLPTGRLAEVAWKRPLSHAVADREVLERLYLEAALGARLYHPGFVRTLGIAFGDIREGIVLEFAKGTSLEKILVLLGHRGLVLPTRLAVWITLQAASALAHLHDLRDDEDRPLGALHRDVNPANMLLARDGRVLLLDLGLAYSDAARHLEREGLVAGKVAYIAPEVLRGERPSPATDVFGLGVVLWELLAGRRLFAGVGNVDHALRVLAGRVPSIRGLDERLSSVLSEALSPEPRDRFPTMSAFAGALVRAVWGMEPPLPADIGWLVQAVRAMERDPRPLDGGSMIDATVAQLGGWPDEVDPAGEVIERPMDP